VRYNELVDRAWPAQQFTARPLSRPWDRRIQPILSATRKHLIVSRGADICTFAFGSSNKGECPDIKTEQICRFDADKRWLSDITGMIAVDQEDDEIVYIGLFDGSLHKISFADVEDSGSESLQRQMLSTLPDGDFVTSVSACKGSLMTLSSDGRITLTAMDDFNSPLDNIEINTRSWSSYLCKSASTPYAAFGTSSSRPLRIHLFSQDKLLPIASVHPFTASGMSEYHSAVYSICEAPPACPWGASPQIFVSGWFDGWVRCYDLRSPTTIPLAPNGSTLSNTALLRPVLSLRDPMQLEPIYSVASGGGSDSYIAAGSARHSAVSFWDVRSPGAGWSVHAPGNDSSPVYSICMESSRLYGATQSRPFVYDFVSFFE
jgi:hypothetical protein